MITAILMLILAHLLFSAWCVFNAFFDAALIWEDRRIYHGVNGAASVLVCGFIAYRTGMVFRGWESVIICFLYAVTCFFNRQISFDIPLNLRRKLNAFYQSIAEHPKAIMDRIERRLFGKISGKSLSIIYFNCFIVFMTTHIIVYFKLIL